MLIGINGGYFPAIYRVFFDLDVRQLRQFDSYFYVLGFEFFNLEAVWWN